MSPNAYVCFNSAGLLVGFQGEEIHEEPCFTWTYSEFEEFLDEAITPSMYHYMANYVRDEITKEELYEIQGGDYCTGDLEAAAVDAYFALPISAEYREFMSAIIENNRAEIDRLQNEIHEEEQWRGGHEEGAEDDAHLNPYDPMEEY